jgi:hypothetical protein
VRAAESIDFVALSNWMQIESSAAAAAAPYNIFDQTRQMNM